MSDDTTPMGADAPEPSAEPTETEAGTATAEAAEVTTPVAKLIEFGADETTAAAVVDSLGIGTLEDLALLTEGDLVDAGMKAVPARKLLATLLPSAPAADTVAVSPVSFDVLPDVLSDESWLKALKAGGVLKVDESSVISAVRAALANRVGLYDVPGRIVEHMERFAEESEEQVDPLFFELRKQLTRRSYGEIFAAVPGLDGSYVTEARKRQLLDRVDRSLWPAIIGFYDQLRNWQDSWMQGAANPGLLMAALVTGGATGTALPPGIMQPPDTGTLRDHADAVNDAVNRVFAGTGVQIAAALAYDATQIKETLLDPRLPALVGAANREQMLKQLGVAVSATYPRLEQNLTRFVLGTMQVADQAPGDIEVRYFSSLLMLGQLISWTELGAKDRRLTGIGGVALRGTTERL